MRNSILSCLILMSALLFSACASTPHPAWVDHPAKTYTQDQYLVGVGLDMDRVKAEEKARAEIAKQFSVSINQTNQTLQEFKGTTGQKGTSWLSRTDIQQLTRTSTEQQLSGVRIETVYKDDDSGLTYALALLERTPARRQLEDKIAKLDQEIKGLYDRATKQDEALSKLRPLLNALEQSKQREALNSQLMVINPTGNGMDAAVAVATLNKALSSALDAIRVSIVLEGDPADELNKHLADSLSQGGLTVVQNPEEAMLRVSGTISGGQTNETNKDKIVYMEYQAQLTLSLNDQTVATLQKRVRDGHLNAADAKRKTLARLLDEVQKEFNDRLWELLAR